MDLSTEDRIEQLSLGISAARVRLSKFNPNHVPSGPKGGQFASGSGGVGGTSAGSSKPVAPKAKPAPKPKVGGDETLRTSAIKSESDLGGGINVVKLITLADGSKAVFKPNSGEAKGVVRQNITPGKSAEREAAAWEVAKVVGMSDMVAPAVVRTVGRERGSVAAWQDGKVASGDMTRQVRYDGEEGAARAAMFDYVIGNSDRHAGNWLVRPNGKLALIDHGLSFPDKSAPSRGNTSILEHVDAFVDLGGSRLKSLAKEYQTNLPKIVSSLKTTGIPPSSIKLLEKRVAALPKVTKWEELL